MRKQTKRKTNVLLFPAVDEPMVWLPDVLAAYGMVGTFTADTDYPARDIKAGDLLLIQRHFNERTISGGQLVLVKDDLTGSMYVKLCRDARVCEVIQGVILGFQRSWFEAAA